MNLRSYQRPKPRIEIIPMIDVIFFLLVFFMLSSLSMTQMQQIVVSLPQVTQQTDAVSAPLVVSIQKDGRLWLNQQVIPLETLKFHLQTHMKEHPEDSLIIRADEKTPYARVIQVMDYAKQIGIRKFALAVLLENQHP